MAREVLVVEDEPDIRRLVVLHLERDGFRCRTATSGEDALREVKTAIPDLVVLDLMLPELDGLEVCRRLRRDTSTASVPIIMLTAKSDEVDRVVGLEVGADDYVGKPFSPKELVARVRAVLRRAHPDHASPVLSVGPVTLDPTRHAVSVDGRAAVLTPKEFDLLQALLDPLTLLFRRAAPQHPHLREAEIRVEPRADGDLLAPDIFDRLRPSDARIGHEHVDRQGAIVGLGLALVAALRKLEGPPRPHEERIGVEIPLVLFGGLDAEPLGRGMQEVQAGLFGDPVDFLAGVLPDLPVGRQPADFRLRKVLDRTAVGLGRERRGDGQQKGGRKVQRERPGIGACHALRLTHADPPDGAGAIAASVAARARRGHTLPETRAPRGSNGPRGGRSSLRCTEPGRGGPAGPGRPPLCSPA